MHRELINKLQAALPVLEGVTFGDIAAPLLQNNVIVQPEYYNLTKAHPDDQMMALVNILAGKEDDLYNVFMDILREEFPSVAEQVLARDDVTDSVPFQTELVTNQNLLNQRLEVARDSKPQVREVEAQKRPGSALCAHSKRIARHDNAVNAATAAGVSTGTIPKQEKNSENTIPDDDNRNQERSDKLSQSVTKEMMALLKKNYRTSRDWTSLAHALGVSRHVTKIRTRVLVYGEDLDVCIMYLLEEWAGEKPKDATLKNLLQVLRGEGFNDVADELVAKFAT